ncbi:two-component sensor histidine kinase [Anaerocolumna cellulosilytica]|uniref:histidine kinase n=1 Tax=Anaerocolumna cellulosilytica TaxID=433286 RepID=A0A6S6R142_9FIRM|nr:HAMP domain-containing sensor histidine kinase [Anaerocolumna cellulosilytica]MBB5197768.1 signal transduction histidine kinase [Anaerocolumna cellulosilytica]BCJ93020.1 two-component sensor histidine kinase [Anaerocolumna cellulosilytica]
MIKKLQKKFIMITMASVFFIILLLIGTINIINIYQMNHRIDGALKILSQNEGTFPKYDKGKPPRENMEFGFQLNEETPFETRYFIVKLNSDGSTREIDTSHIRAVSSSDAREYAEEILESGKTGGFAEIYKYAVVAQDYGYMVIFIDCRNSIQSVTGFLFISSVVALGIILLMFILVSVFSKKAITPIIESMDKQKQFITDAGHEIKTPLAIISANADVLELTGGESEWINSIRNQITRLDKLVKNLLILSKMDEGNMKVSYVEFDISRTVEETVASFKAVAETLNKTFLLDIQEGLKLYGDESSIQQLVSTLVDNALKYSDSNGIIKVSLITYKKGSKLEVFNTTDMGKEALSKEYLSKLFDRFYRADASRSRDTGGYGIGLSIARSIVEAHHGKISARREEETGICFEVILG